MVVAMKEMQGVLGRIQRGCGKEPLVRTKVRDSLIGTMTVKLRPGG